MTFIHLLCLSLIGISVSFGVETTATTHTLTLNEKPAVIWCADIDGDGRDELIVISNDGVVSCDRIDNSGHINRIGCVRLPDPAYTLMTLTELNGKPGRDLLIADRRGFSLMSWPTTNEAKIPSAVVQSLIPTAKQKIRLGQPLESPLAVDINNDQRNDLLLPKTDGILPFINDSNDTGILFHSLPLVSVPVTITLTQPSEDQFSGYQGHVTIPQLNTKDLNGDGRLDLIHHDQQQWGFTLQQSDGSFAPPISVDLAKFVDHTPVDTSQQLNKFVLPNKQTLLQGDINNDGLPDMIITHRRKIWIFLSSTAGPQFTDASIQIFTEDVGLVTLVDLDNDHHDDLVTVKVQFPSAAKIMLSLISSFNIEMHVVGYRSNGTKFIATPEWRRDIILSLPSIPTIVSLLDEWQERAKKITQSIPLTTKGRFCKRQSPHVAITDDKEIFSNENKSPLAPEMLDMALYKPGEKQLSLYEKNGEIGTSSELNAGTLLQRYVFKQSDPVYTVERIFGLLDDFSNLAAGMALDGHSITQHIPVRDPAQWRLQQLNVVTLASQPRDVITLLYRRNTSATKTTADPADPANAIGTDWVIDVMTP